MSEKLKKSRWHSCNVLQVSAETRQIWQFDARNSGFVLNREQTSFAGEPLPAKLVAWTTADEVGTSTSTGMAKE